MPFIISRDYAEVQILKTSESDTAFPLKVLNRDSYTGLIISDQCSVLTSFIISGFSKIGSFCNGAYMTSVAC